MNKPICFEAGAAKVRDSKRKKILDITVYKSVDDRGQEVFTYKIKNRADITLDKHVLAECLLYVVSDIVSYVGDPYCILELFEEMTERIDKT